MTKGLQMMGARSVLNSKVSNGSSTTLQKAKE